MRKMRPDFPGASLFRDFVDTPQMEGSSEPRLFDLSKEKVKERLERLDKEIVEKQESFDFKRLFDLYGKFYRYSFRNCLLIFYQFPYATFVAGSQEWIRKWNRIVKGPDPITGVRQRGIQILAPNMQKDVRTVKDPLTGVEEKQEYTHLAGFRVAYVFDVSQTVQMRDKPIKFDESLLHTKVVPTTEDIQFYYDKFLVFLKSKDIPVRFQSMQELGLAKGSTDGKIITIRDDLQVTEALFVLLHEYAHYMLHWERISEEVEVKDPKTGKTTTKIVSRIVHIVNYKREIKELQAESVILVVGETLNLFTGANKLFYDDAVHYLATWKKQEQVIDSLTNVHGISREILKILHRPTVPISEMSI
jgi:hypothetical protein